jgi:hypothetical protein
VDTLTKASVDAFPELQAGDILLYGGTDAVSRLIQFRTWSDVSHIEVYVGEGRSVASCNGIGVGKYPLRIQGLRRVLRPTVALDLTDGLKWFDSVNGTPYSWADLLRFYLIDVPTKGLICSEFGDMFFKACGLPLFNTDYPEGSVCPRDFEIVSSLLVKQIWTWK